MKQALVVVLFWFCVCTTTNPSSTLVLALFKEDAGLFDFQVKTSGHGVTNYVYTFEDDVLITSDSSSSSSSSVNTADGCSTSCYVASRRIDNGELLWRRNVCSDIKNHHDGRGGSSCHVVTAKNDVVYTMDQMGVVRAWDIRTGALLWDALVGGGGESSSSPPRLWTFVGGDANEEEEKEIVGAIGNDDEQLYLIDAVSGKTLSILSATDALMYGNIPQPVGSSSRPYWLHDLSTSKALVGWVSTTTSKTTATASHVSMVQWDDKTYTWNGAIPLQQLTAEQEGEMDTTMATPFDVQSLRRFSEQQFLALSSNDASQMVQLSLAQQQQELVTPASQLDPLWTSLQGILTSLSEPGIIRIMGNRQPEGGNHKPNMGLYLYDANHGTWNQWYAEGGPQTNFQAISFCPLAGILVAVEQQQGETLGTLHVWRVESALDRQQQSLTIRGDRTVTIPEDDTITGFTMLSCTSTADDASLSTLLHTAYGTTIQLGLSMLDKTTVQSTIGWTTEEGLGQISMGIMLDSSHLHVEDLFGKDEAQEVAQRLQFRSRLISQYQSIVDTMTSLFLLTASSQQGPTDDQIAHTTMASMSRDNAFGFVKVAVLLSEKLHRVWGIATSGKHRGVPPLYVVDLPKQAQWHKLVHGTTNSQEGTHGINGGTHTNDVLLLSSTEPLVQWTCFSGTNGVIHEKGSTHITSPIVQIIPLVSGSELGAAASCKQRAVLIHQDHSISVVPKDDPSLNKEMLKHQIRNNKNGFYTHVVHKDKPRLETFQIAEGDADQDDSFQSRLIGKSSFPEERVVKVAYPIRDEVVQSPCTVLGDESLLLKYLNPHLAVIITVKDSVSSSSSSDPFVSVLKNTNIQNNNNKRKPTGATPPGKEGDNAATTTPAVEDEPNLFVNVMDTVSGRILHRVSHTHAKIHTDVSVVVSENWIYYTFVNQKTRKTELGVITLYEGMIHSKGLTAFTSPAQMTTFSSLDARESKPVVLAATFSLPRPATALGVTSTKSGISSRQLLVATADGRIFAIQRQMIEPRRPIGEVKESEKTEGLHQYAELIPLVALQALSYNLTIESVTTIVSSATDLESQSLVLAFGGPDIFFTRTSPSKGFDLLPESFNKLLLSLVVIGLLTVLFVLKNMSSNKMVQQGWK